jgi:hypothetical protein
VRFVAPVLAFTEAGVAAIVAATLSGIGAVLGGIAAVLSARHRREVRRQIKTPNGESLGELAYATDRRTRRLEHRVRHVEGDLAEHLGEAEPLKAWVLRRMQEEDGR